MTQNPYAAPSAQPSMPSPPSGGTGVFHIGTCLSEAWEATKDNLGPLIGINIVGGVCTVISTFTCVGLFLLVPIFMWGYAYVYLRAYDGELDFGDVFAGFSRYGEALVPMLVFLLLYVVLSLPSNALNYAGAALDEPALTGLGYVVGAAIGFTVTVRLYFAPFYVVDRQMSGLDALKASWEATSHQKLELIGLVILSGIVAMLGVLVFCVGILVSMNVSYLMFASAYRQVAGRGDAGDY